MHCYNSSQLEELRAALTDSSVPTVAGQGRVQRVPYPRVVEVLRSGRFDLSDAEITQVRGVFRPRAPQVARCHVSSCLRRAISMHSSCVHVWHDPANSPAPNQCLSSPGTCLPLLLPLLQLLSSFHVDQDGCIDIDEWMAALYDWSSVQDSPEWDALVERVFNSLDVDGSGTLGVEELESLLCDPDAGCPIADEVPSLLRDAEGAASALEPGTRVVKSEAGGPMVWQSGGQRAELSRPGGRINLTAFARLLRSARQDRLDLFESRRIARAGSQEPA
jgi:hypothetical protein